MPALANPVVSRLANKAPGWAAPDFCGLLLVTNWPATEAVRQHYAEMRAFLVDKLPACAYLYPPATLHCTVATLRAFTAGALDGEDREAEAIRWRAVLNAARAMRAWPKGAFRLRLLAPTLDGAAGIVTYEEVGGTAHIEAMRSCVREAISATGALAAEGGGSRDNCRALPGAPKGDPSPHIPNIMHSTVLRWAAEPTAAELKEAQTAFKAIAATWRPIEMTVDSGCVGVFEDVPFMHIPHSASQIFWRSEARASDLIRDEPKPPPSYLSLLLEVIATFLLPVLLIVLAVALRGPKHYFQLPGKPQP